MTRSNPELERLRAEAIRLHNAATKKISRLRNVKGVDIGMTDYDPRVGPGAIRSMNRRQVQAHVRKLDAFRSRRTSFVAGREGVAIPINKWKTYGGVESTNRELGRAYFNSIKDVKLRNGQTLEEYKRDMEGDTTKRMGFTRGNRIFMQGERKPSNIAGVKGVDKLIKDLEKKNRPKALKEAIKLARNNMEASLSGGGVAESIVAKAKKLTDYQVDILWHHTKFAQDAGEHYFFHDNDRVIPTTTQADRESQLEKDIEWASGLQEPETAIAQSPRRRRR